MDLQRIVNIFSLIAGIGVLILGVVVRTGALSTVEPGRSITMFVLGGIMVLWALISMRRNR